MSNRTYKKIANLVSDTNSLRVTIKKKKNKKLLALVDDIMNSTEDINQDLEHDENYVALMTDHMKKIMDSVSHISTENAKQRLNLLKKEDRTQFMEERRHHRFFIHLMKPYKHIIKIGNILLKKLESEINIAEKLMNSNNKIPNDFLSDLRDKRDSARQSYLELSQMVKMAEKLCSYEFALEEKLVTLGASGGILDKETTEAIGKLKKHIDISHLKGHRDKIGHDINEINDTEVGILALHHKIGFMLPNFRRVAMIAAIAILPLHFLSANAPSIVKVAAENELTLMQQTAREAENGYVRYETKNMYDILPENRIGIFSLNNFQDGVYRSNNEFYVIVDVKDVGQYNYDESMGDVFEHEAIRYLRQLTHLFSEKKALVDHANLKFHCSNGDKVAFYIDDVHFSVPEHIEQFGHKLP